jgi:hypothetical protein
MSGSEPSRAASCGNRHLRSSPFSISAVSLSYQQILLGPPLRAIAIYRFPALPLPVFLCLFLMSFAILIVYVAFSPRGPLILFTRCSHSLLCTTGTCLCFLLLFFGYFTCTDFSSAQIHAFWPGQRRAPANFSLLYLSHYRETQFVPSLSPKSRLLPQRVTASLSHTNASPSQFLLFLLAKMSAEHKKQERDFTPEVDLLLPEATSLAKASNISSYTRRKLNFLSNRLEILTKL